ncbi:hypothetical protein Tco_1067524 [Tanacetum coccineum]|uniref:Uncharacterized protein n=1 Tax=Tanacetum coccineum TaxID=301880 RepID=A0ABQ5HEY0_9ASTR
MRRRRGPAGGGDKRRSGEKAGGGERGAGEERRGRGGREGRRSRGLGRGAGRGRAMRKRRPECGAGRGSGEGAGRAPEGRGMWEQGGAGGAAGEEEPVRPGGGAGRERGRETGGRRRKKGRVAKGREAEERALGGRKRGALKAERGGQGAGRREGERSWKEKYEQAKEEKINDQLPAKESNPGHFTLPSTISNFNIYAMADLGASVNVEDSIWSKRYSEWCNENSHDKKPRPRDYNFKEWVKLKKGHLNISKSVRKDLFRSWVSDQFTEALDPNKNPLERCLDEYNWRARCKNKYWWYDYWYEDEEKTELGNEDYDPPMVHIETFEVTKYKFNNGCSFICVSGENNETLSLGRKNGSRFRKMIMEEMEEVLRNDGDDSYNET